MLNNNFDEIKNILTEYIEANKLRKTAERFAILEEIYSNEIVHFSIDNLYLAMKNKNFIVTKTTLYSTIDILLESGLIEMHYFGKNNCIYEKTFARSRHDHIICKNCGKIVDASLPIILELHKKINKIYKFKVESHSLCFLGLCNDCNKALINNQK